MNKEIHLYLKGGLGNQLFQTAYALSLSKNLGSRLTVDNVSGFRLDTTYNRTFELDSFFEMHEIGHEKWVLLKRLWNRYPKVKYLARLLGLNVVSDSFIGNFQAPYIIIDGYFQSESYFYDNRMVLAEKLKRMLPNLEKSKVKEYISVGIRLYEETENPTQYSRSGIPFDFQSFLSAIVDENPAKTIKVFTFSVSQALIQFCKRHNIDIVEGKNSSLSTWETLEIFGLGEKLYFNNSTFYWWGAWASDLILERNGSGIKVYDDFLATDTVPKRWSKIDCR
jgi:hypothetical protein